MTTTMATFVLLAAALGAGSQQERRRMPDSPTGRMAGALIELAQSPSQEGLQSFLKERVVPDAPVELQTAVRRFHEELAGARLQGAEKRAEFAARLRLAAPDGATAHVRYEIEPEPPHRLTALELETADDPEAPELRGTTDPVRATDAYFSRIARDDGFSGSLLVARRGEILYEGFFGAADRRARTPVTAETKFDVGSITKMMTKVAIGQLARDGKLALDDSIATHLPDYPNRDAAERITIQHLVDHRSGLGDVFTPEFARAPKETFIAPSDYFVIFADAPLAFEPGTSERYSNSGYIVLGAVVEAASGIPYFDYMNEHVFAPAGMTASGFLARDGSRPDVATGYTRQRGFGNPRQRDGASRRQRGGGDPIANYGMLPHLGCPAGSSSHTAKDLWRFERALTTGKLLGPRWTEWFLRGSRSFGVGGGGPGVNAMLESDGELTIVALSNLDPPAAQDAASRLSQIWKK